VLFGCLSLLLSISITGSQQDLKMRNILCNMPYQRLILGQEEHNIIYAASILLLNGEKDTQIPVEQAFLL
jgi:hypothetical protein